MGDNCKVVNDSNWDQEVVKSDILVLVDFWAEWCGPCHAIAPTVSSIADTYAGRMKVGKLNVDENEQTAAKYGIRSIPTLMLLKGGEVKEVLIGNRPKNEIVLAIDKHL